MLSYEVDTIKTLLVSGDRKTHELDVVALGGVWSSEKNGWIMPRRNQSALNQLIIRLGEKRHKKFHREVSDDEVEPSESAEIQFYKKFQRSKHGGESESDGVYSSSDDDNSSGTSSGSSSDGEAITDELKHLKDVVNDIGYRIKTLESISKRR